jgi:hypothetical protein
MNKSPSIPSRQAVPALKKEYQWPLDLLALVGLALVTVYFLVISWRKWPDELIDFGRELYTPWRLAQGAVLYRDVDGIYGPLSQHFNAALFSLFGPGMMVLVIANLAIFSATLLALYVLFRRAWGRAAAFVAGSIFIAVFGFSQLVSCGNYNFATPYAHEVTHGFLVSLLLVIALSRWVAKTTLGRGLLAGGLLGLVLVLKPEFILADGLITFAAVVLSWRQRGRVDLHSVIAVSVGALLPTVLFAGYFSLRLPPGDALAAACRAWLNVVSTTNFTGDVSQAAVSGLDQPWTNFKEHLIATLWAVLVLAILALGTRAAGSVPAKWQRWTIAVALLAGMGWVGSTQVKLIPVGRCLLGLALLYAMAKIHALKDPVKPGKRMQPESLRLLVALLAAALMARMVLNGRIYHYGFFQAALAGVLVPAVLIGEVPSWIQAQKWAQVVIMAGTLLLVGPVVIETVSESNDLLRQKTMPVGEGPDMFYAFAPEVWPGGELVEMIARELRKQPEGQTLLVLPEGTMINYLARKPSPVAPVLFFSATIRDGREEQIVRQLEQRPPDWVALISRDLREFGINRYGEGPGAGEQLVQWVGANYEGVLSLGGDPLDPAQFGGRILRRKSSSMR